MGLIYAEVELINAEDLGDARKKRISDGEVRRMTVTMLVDSGAYMLCINEKAQQQLQFPIIEKRSAELANGHIVELDIVTAVELRFKNRRCLVDALVLPGECEMLLGAIPMENMDVLINPLKEELIVNPAHPYQAQMKVK